MSSPFEGGGASPLPLGAVDKIVADMYKRWPKPRLTCAVCGVEEPGKWEYLKTGWPKHCDQTMNLSNS